MTIEERKAGMVSQRGDIELNLKSINLPAEYHMKDGERSGQAIPATE